MSVDIRDINDDQLIMAALYEIILFCCEPHHEITEDTIKIKDELECRIKQK